MTAGVPTQFTVYNHSVTMRKFLIKALEDLQNEYKKSPLSFERYLFQMLIDYPFLVYCGICFLRGRAAQHLETNRKKYELEVIGNEEQLLRNYSVEIRNTPLELIADSLEVSIEIRY